MSKKHCHLGHTYDPTCIGCEAVNEKEECKCWLTEETGKMPEVDKNGMCKHGVKVTYSKDPTVPDKVSGYGRGAGGLFIDKKQLVGSTLSVAIPKQGYGASGTHGFRAGGGGMARFIPERIQPPNPFPFDKIDTDGNPLYIENGILKLGKTVDEAVKRERERVVKKIEEYFSQQIHAQYPPIVKKSLIYFLSTHND